MNNTSEPFFTEMLKAVRSAFSDITLLQGNSFKDEYERRRHVLEREIIPAILGPAPEWSQPTGYQVGRGAIFNAGSFCVYWGKDPDSGKVVALLHIRKETNEKNHHKFGALGGYTEKPEQSVVGVLREAWKEEVCTPDGAPVIIPDMITHTIVLEGKDYVSKDPPVQYVGYACELTAEQIRSLKDYIQKCENPEYQQGVTQATKGETFGIRLMPLEDVINLPPDSFTYHRQHAVYCEVASRLGIGQERIEPSSPVGYTIGNSPALYTSRIQYDLKDRITKGFPPF